MIWFAIGILLLIFEVLGAAGFLLGAAAAAIVMGIVMLIAPDTTWPIQVLIYAVISIVLTLLCLRFFRVHWRETSNTLKTPTEDLIGKQFILDRSVAKNQEVSIQLSGTRWIMVARSSLNEGDEVKVIDADAQRLGIDHVTKD